jgi:hypothetical protein
MWDTVGYFSGLCVDLTPDSFNPLNIKTCSDLIWINPTSLVLKPDKKVKLVIHTRKVNKLKTR